MHEYIFKMKKGDIEIELKSDDLEFVEEQLNKWREVFYSTEVISKVIQKMTFDAIRKEL